MIGSGEAATLPRDQRGQFVSHAYARNPKLRFGKMTGEEVVRLRNEHIAHSLRERKLELDRARLQNDVVVYLLARNNWSTHDIAKRSGCSQTMVSYALTGSRVLGQHTFAAICSLLPSDPGEYAE